MEDLALKTRTSPIEIQDRPDLQAGECGRYQMRSDPFQRYNKEHKSALQVLSSLTTLAPIQLEMSR
jgi:hypothetical protein